MKLSVIIPARNEWPNVVFTIYSILHCLEADGYTYKDFEIIIVDNGSNDDTFPRRGVKGTLSYLIPRGIYWSRVLRVIKDPIFGNHSARNKGAEVALGDYLFFSDAHMAYRPGFFKHMFETIDETGGLFHGVIGWLGAYPPYPGGLGYQYTIKLGEQIKGTWNNYCLDTEKWFYIPSQGHCSVGVKRDQFFEFGGYPGLIDPQAHLCSYGGGEFYLDFKWWIFGSTVAVHPQAIGYHLASERGYSYHYDDYIKNVMAIGYALGMDDWLERAYINWLRKGRKEVLDKLMEEIKWRMAKDREFIENKRVKTFNDIIVERTWDKLNQERLGKSNAGLQIIHDTWLTHLREAPQYVQDVYDNSKLQKGLEAFINKHLDKYVYKRKR